MELIPIKHYAGVDYDKKRSGIRLVMTIEGKKTVVTKQTKKKVTAKTRKKKTK